MHGHLNIKFEEYILNITDRVAVIKSEVYIWREGGREGGRKGGKEGGKNEGGKEGRKEGRKDGRKEGRKEGRETGSIYYNCI